MDQTTETECQKTKDNDNNNSGRFPQSHSVNRYSLDPSCHRYVSRENGKQIPLYRSNDHVNRALDMMNEMQKMNMLCDVILVTDDGFEVPTHKIILIACSPYFHMMFKNGECEENRIVLNGIHHDILKLLLDFMYSTKIHITEGNVQGLLTSANFLQLTDVTNACSDFILTHLHPSKCIKIREFANQNDCFELLAQIDGYIEYYFSEIIQYEEFLSLSAQQLVELISNDYLRVSSEIIVFECVISWINHNRIEREKYYTQVIEQVRLPLMSDEDLLERIWEEELVKANSQAKNCLIEALEYHSLKQRGKSLFETPRAKPREFRELPKMLVVVGGKSLEATKSVESYDFRTNRWFPLSDLPTNFCDGGVLFLAPHPVYAVGGCNLIGMPLKSMNVYDSSVDQWSACPEMRVARKSMGIATVDNCIYAIGGRNLTTIYSSVEVYDPITRKWTMITSMPAPRCRSAVGVVDGRLYVVGGYEDAHKKSLASVLCYDPPIRKWINVANLATGRKDAGAGVLNGILYVVGGANSGGAMKSVEAFDPKTNKWTQVKDMPEAVVGLDEHLYVVGGENETGCLSSVNMYSPESDSWEVLPSSMNIERVQTDVAVIVKPHNYI